MTAAAWIPAVRAQPGLGRAMPTRELSSPHPPAPIEPGRCRRRPRPPPPARPALGSGPPAAGSPLPRRHRPPATGRGAAAGLSPQPPGHGPAAAAASGRRRGSSERPVPSGGAVGKPTSTGAPRAPPPPGRAERRREPAPSARWHRPAGRHSPAVPAVPRPPALARLWQRPP